MPLRGSALAVAPLLLVPDARRPPAPLAPGTLGPGRGAATAPPVWRSSVGPAAASPSGFELAAANAARAPQPRAHGLGAQVGRTIDLLEHAGWLGQASVVLAFSLWVCLSLPSTPVEVAAGFLYGPFWGVACGLLSKMAGSVAAFLLARSIGRHLGWQLPAALGAKLPALRSRPLLALVGLRLAPLPLGVKNYGLGLSEVGLGQYLLAALIVDLPFSVLWASTGASCHSLADALNLGESRPQPSVVSRELPAGLLLLLVAWAAFSWRRRSLDTGINTYIGTIAIDD